MDLPYAETINYWKTSKSSPDSWLDKAESIIEQLGGEVSIRAIGKQDGNRAFIMDFSFSEERFRAVWPVLPVKGNDMKAAERQAATLLFHDIKSRSLKASIFGARNAFFDFLMLPGGRTLSQVSTPEIENFIPKALNK